MSHRRIAPLAAALSILAATAVAQAPQLSMRDLDGKNPRRLEKDEVTALMTGAKISRISQRGNRQDWTNEPGGSFVASSDNRGAGMPGAGQGRPSSAQGKWHISDDGRYCIMIEWGRLGTEDWCRYVVETGDGHYVVRSMSNAAERVEKLEVRK
jgi:hypothetical protein